MPSASAKVSDSDLARKGKYEALNPVTSGTVEPRLATECTANDDASVWTCALRTGVVFHDGSTLDANDVVVSWQAGLDGRSPLHVGNTGAFEYYGYLWTQTIPENAPEL